MTIYQNVSNCTIINGKKIDLEKLAELEHKQWIDWSQTLINRLKEWDNEGMPLHTAIETLLQRWKSNWIPYEYLNEETKEYDRVYARKVLEVI